jgi:membrane protein DedA with SNARE-associated domain
MKFYKTRLCIFWLIIGLIAGFIIYNIAKEFRQLYFIILFSELIVISIIIALWLIYPCNKKNKNE